MDLDIATISSKGQIVIPKRLRKGFKKGDKVLLIRDGESFMMKRLDVRKEDLEFARRTEQAWRDYEKGKYVEMEMDQFLEAAKKW